MTMDQYALQVRDHLGNTFNVAIARFPFWIGRGAENDLVLNEPSVSKRHAFLSRVPGGLAINDNESRNGVFLNKEKERLNQPRPLAVGDTLRIGLARIRLQRSGAPEIPLHTRALSTLTFVPTREAWDPIQKLTTGLARSAGGPAQRDHAPGWQKMLSRLLLEASTPGVYELMLDMVEEAISFDRCFIVLFERGDPEEISIAAKRVRG
ncbi:MAG: FHA domain-containing protein, partial [Planctomycetes bacterium]|nr:FHA domain-containing protein [Planctomycetota bacterium]